MPSISPASYARFRTCPRLYYFTNVLYLERVRQDGARAFGTMYHAGLEAWWRAMDGGDDPWRDADAALVTAIKAIHSSGSHIDTDPFERARAEALITNYHARNFELFFETVTLGGGVEESFDVPLRDVDGVEIKDWRVRGRRDACKRFADGRVKVAEHKTTSMDISLASDYWTRLKIDTQISIYIDAAQQLGLDVHEALYDVSRRPTITPLKKTPEEKRRTTKGKGCPHCGGRKGGKDGASQGTGKIMVRTSVDGDGRPLAKPTDVETTCTSCDGTGWHEAPRLDAKQRLEDEPVEDFKARIHEEINADPNAHFRMGSIPRSTSQLEEARADLVMTTGEIATFVSMAKERGDGDARSVAARRCFPRNDAACTNQYGRPCDFISVCSGAVEPFTSPLYRISTRRP